MKLLISIFVSTFLCFISGCYSEHNEVINDITITDAIVFEQGYVRETIPGTTTSAAYLTLKNMTDTDVLLTGVTSHISERIELHNHDFNNDIMQMRKLDQVVIPANEKVVLEPSGMHIMIFDLEKGLQAQERVHLNLQFFNAQTQEVVLPVRSIKTEFH